MKRFTRSRDWTGHLSSDPIVSRLNRIERTRKSSRDRGRSVHAMFPTNVRAILVYGVGIMAAKFDAQQRMANEPIELLIRTFVAKNLRRGFIYTMIWYRLEFSFFWACEPCPTGIFINAVAYLFVDHCASFDFSRRSYLYYVGEKFLLDAIVMHSVDIITRVNILFFFFSEIINNLIFDQTRMNQFVVILKKIKILFTVISR